MRLFSPLFPKIAVAAALSVTFFPAPLSAQTQTPIQTPRTLPQWLDTAVFYQIYPATFQDSNGDGIGDLRGIISRLDYIRSVGVNAVWFSPLFCSEFQDGGYDITDFYRIDPRYGTNAQLVELVRKAHEKGLKICLDLVAGHTSDKHPWFVQSQAADTNLQYSDYYIWTHSRDDLDGWALVPSAAARDGNYRRNFFDCQPALNYGFAKIGKPWERPWMQSADDPGPQAVRRELRNIIAFWMDKGVDGFRVDMAPSLIKGDEENDYRETYKLWGELRDWFSARYPSGVLISEWGVPSRAIPAGFHIDFLMQVGLSRPYASLFYNQEGVQIRQDTCYFQRSGVGNLTEFLDAYRRELAATQGLGHIALPTANHDTQRLSVGDRTDPRELKVAMTFFLTMPGTPFIYYGDEIGMRFLAGPMPNKEGSVMGSPEQPANRAGTRTPMQWTDTEPHAGFSTAPDSALYLPIDPRGDRPTVDAQDPDPGSLLNYVRGLIALRKSCSALGAPAAGPTGWELLHGADATDAYPMVYRRGEYLIALNPTDRSVSASLNACKTAKYIYGTDPRAARLSSGRLTLKPLSAAIWQISD